MRTLAIVITILVGAAPAAGQYSGGSGTASDPFRIEIPADLIEMSNEPNDWGKHFVLTGDIDMSGHTFSNSPIAPDLVPGDWEMGPFTFEGPEFTGVFDGQGYAFENLTISGRHSYLGLFGQIGAQGQVMNLIIRGGSVGGASLERRIGGLCGSNKGTISNCYTNVSVSGMSWGMGGLAGVNSGDIIDCHAAGDVLAHGFGDINGGSYGGLCASNTGRIYRSYATGDVQGGTDTGGLGGLVGGNGGIIDECYATGAIGADGCCIGGLAGSNSGTITKSYATGSADGYNGVGGLVGSCSGGEIKDCYSSGRVGSILNSSRTGGLVGDNSATITNCYSTGQVDEVTYYEDRGGLVGRNAGTVLGSFWDIQASSHSTSNGGTGLTTQQMMTIATFTDAGWDFLGEYANGTEDIWRMCVHGSDYPKFHWDYPADEISCPNGIERYNFVKFAAFASTWLNTDCGSTNNWCRDEDVDQSGVLNGTDLSAFADKWLDLPTVVTEGLVGYWRFDAGFGTTALDSSGYNNTGKFIGNPLWTLGKLGHALEFTDANDAVEIETLQLDPNMGTIVLWALPEAPTRSVHYLFGHTSGWIYSDRIQLYLQSYDDDPNIYLEAGLGDSHRVAAQIQSLNPAQWYHIALTWDEGHYEVFLEGQLKAEGLYSGLSVSGPFADIGNNGSPAPQGRDEAFFGQIDEVRIYNRAIDQNQVSEIYHPNPVTPEDMVRIPGGTFEMGDTLNEFWDMPEEQPVHTVTVDSFYMGKYEITNRQYCEYLGTTPPQGREDHPAENVSWFAAVKYCNWRSQQEGLESCYDLSTWECDFTKNGYRLPTEAEWEYAARGGLPGKRFPWGDTISHSLANYRCYIDVYPDLIPYDLGPTPGFHPTWSSGASPYTSPSGYFLPNGYGLYDMAGNASEWCNDWFDENYYDYSPNDNPTGPTSGSERILRGGSWEDPARECRVAWRNGVLPDVNENHSGFRVVLNDSSLSRVSLIGHWDFDEGSGTSAADSSRFGNIGVLVGNPLWTLSKIGYALQFSDANDAVQIGTDRFDSNMGTISMWAYPEAFSQATHYLFGHTSGSVYSDRIQLYVQSYDGDPNAYLQLGLGDSHTVASRIESLNPNQWYHIALTWDQGHYKVYVDGQLKAEGQYDGLSLLGTFADIGNNGNPDPQRRHEAFSGIIDEVRIHNRAISRIAVSEIYNSQRDRCDTCVPDDMALIPAGTFEMGDSFGEFTDYRGEGPVHTVVLDSFYIGKYEITNRQYCDYLKSAHDAGDIRVADGIVYAVSDTGNTFRYFRTHASYDASQIAYSAASETFSVRTKVGRDMSFDPVVCVSWYGSVAHCNWRSRQEGKEICYDLSEWQCDFSKAGYRLPTEAEWEYSARGGLEGRRFPWGDTISHSQANYCSYWSEGAPISTYDMSLTEGYHPTWNDGVEPYTSPVGTFAPNGYGLYEMAGNVYEWCNDWFSSDYYQRSPTVNPTGPLTGRWRVIRGGGWPRWEGSAGKCRVTWRYESSSYRPWWCARGGGFRIALVISPAGP